MTRVVIPPHAGVLSAIGLAIAPERREGLASFVTRADAVDALTLGAMLNREVTRLRRTGTGVVGASAGAGALMPRWWARVRYDGQGYEMDVPIEPGDNGATIAQRFVDRHRTRSGFVLDRAVECVSIRTALVGTAWPVEFRRAARNGATQPPSDVDDGLALDRTIVGPAVVRLSDATLYVAAGWTARAQPIGGWLMERA